MNLFGKGNRGLTLDARLGQATGWALWLFALVTTLSIAMQNVFFVALAAWVFRRAFVQKRSLAFPRWGWVWVAFISWALLASLAAPNQAHSLVTWRKWLLASAAWCVSDAVEDEVSLRGLLATLLVGAALVNLGASLIYGCRPLLAWLHGEPWAQVSRHWVLDYGVQWRARGGSGGYMVLAACDALLLVFYASLAVEDGSWRRPGVYASLASLALGLLLTMTRGAWLAAAAALGLLLFWRRPRLGLGLAAALALGLVLAPRSVFVRRLRTVGDLNNGSNRERIYMAEAGLRIVRDHPWLGVGDSLHSYDVRQPDGALKATPGYFLSDLTPEAVAWFKVHDPGKDNGHLHDVALQLMAMYGLPGLGLALVFFVGLVVWGLGLNRGGRTDLARGVGLGLAMGLIAYFLHGATEYNLGSVQSSFTLWFVIGLSGAAGRLDGGQAFRGPFKA